MTLNKYISKAISLILGFSLSIALIIFIPYLSGSIHDDEVNPVLVINSIDFYKKTTLKKKELKKKPKIVKKKPKKVTKKIKKQQKRIVKKQEIIKPVEKKFSTKKKQVEKELKSQEDEFPTPEPIYRVTERPYILKAIEPKYPPDMHRLGKTAVVTVDALIDRRGKVRRTTIYKSAGKSFDAAAMNAIKKSVFEPGKVNGKPVAVLYRMKIKFNLI